VVFLKAILSVQTALGGVGLDLYLIQRRGITSTFRFPFAGQRGMDLFISFLLILILIFLFWSRGACLAKSRWLAGFNRTDH